MRREEEKKKDGGGARKSKGEDSLRIDEATTGGSVTGRLGKHPWAQTHLSRRRRMKRQTQTGYLGTYK
jgi:hypothetical protein